MKIKHVMPEEMEQHIEDLQSIISEIEMAYAEKIKKFPFMENEIRKAMSEDRNLEMLGKTIADIYMRAPVQIIVEAENEEEMEKLRQMWRASECQNL